MSTAGNNLLTGLAQLADTIGAQAGAIVNMRRQSAAQAAQAEIGLINARFLADLQSIDPATGQYKIKPADYDSAFAAHKEKLSGFADTMDFEPAKDAVRGIALDGLPELYVRGAQEMNKQMFAQIASDTKKEWELIPLTPGITVQDIYKKRIKMIDRARGGPLQGELEGMRASAAKEYHMESAREELNSFSPDMALQLINNPRWAKEKGLDTASANALMVGIQNKGNMADSLAETAFMQQIAKDPQRYWQMDEADSFGAATSFGKAKLRGLADSHNADILEQHYQDQINSGLFGKDPVASLTALRDKLVSDKKENDELGQSGKELAIGVKEDDARQRLIAKLNVMLTPDASGKSAIEDDKALTMYKGILEKYNRLLSGQAKPGDKAKFLADVKVGYWTTNSRAFTDAYGDMYTKTLTELTPAQKGDEKALDAFGKLLATIPYYKENPADLGNAMQGAWDIIMNEKKETGDLDTYMDRMRTEAFKRKPLEATGFTMSPKGVVKYGQERIKTGAWQSPLDTDVQNERAFMASEKTAFIEEYPDLEFGMQGIYGSGLLAITGKNKKVYTFDYSNGKRELYEVNPETMEVGAIIPSIEQKRKIAEAEAIVKKAKDEEEIAQAKGRENKAPIGAR
jgi:hypothetical protein